MQWRDLLSDKHFREESEENNIYKCDYDTIICSTLFWRLQDEAQVFPLDDDNYVRTRLTHSLEVSAIGKKIGEYVFHRLKELKIDDWFEEHTEKEFHREVIEKYQTYVKFFFCMLFSLYFVLDAL